MAATGAAGSASLPRGTTPPACIGIEQEFQLWRGSAQVDFRHLIHTLPIDGLRLDPGDANAYRLKDGAVLTCDEAEAEVACPPVAIAPGFAAEVTAWAARGRRVLEDFLPDGCTLRGYSTHVSVSVPGPPDVDLAERYARTYAPVFAAAIDRPTSLGVYVRPRPGRLELCGEFVEGKRLGAVAALAAGSVLACARGYTPPALTLELLPCKERFGFRVHRTAAGFDLYASGRTAALRRAGGGTILLQELLEEALEHASDALRGRAAEADLDGLERVVRAASPLGIECTEGEYVAPTGAPAASAFRVMARAWDGSGGAIVPRMALWSGAVFEATGETRSRFVAVPPAALEGFAAAVDADVDRAIADVFAATAGDELATPEQLATGGVYATIGRVQAELVLKEIRRGKGTDSKPGKTPVGRIGKFAPAAPEGTPSVPSPPLPPAGRPYSPEPAPPPTQGRPRAWAVGAGVAILALLGGSLVLLNSGSETDEPPGTTMTAIAPTGTPTPGPTSPSTATPTRQRETAVGSGPPALTPSPRASATETPPLPTATAGPAETQAPSSTPTVKPTETPIPTRTPLPTETPRPTNTPTLSPTQDGGGGAVETPPPRPIPTPTACVPGGGVVCPN